MPLKPHLTKADLKAICERSVTRCARPAMGIRRLRAIVLRADQLQRVLGEMGGSQGLVLDSLRAEIEGEPCVEEFPKLNAD